MRGSSGVPGKPTRLVLVRGARGCGVIAAPTNPARSWAGFDRSVKAGRLCEEKG